MFKTTLLGLAALIIVPPVFCEHPDFSGSWQLDVAASSFGTMAIPVSGTLTISTGRHKMMHMEMMLKTPQSERTVESDWKVDDKYHPDLGDQAGEVLAKWDGSALLGKRYTEAGMEEVRLMANSGGAALMETIQSPSGLSTLVWRRR